MTAVVLDPSFAGTEIELHLEEAAERYRFDLGRHEGSVLDPGDIPDSFRGPAMADLARRAAGADGLLDAAAIGRALDRFPVHRANAVR